MAIDIGAAHAAGALASSHRSSNRSRLTLVPVSYPPRVPIRPHPDLAAASIEHQLAYHQFRAFAESLEPPGFEPALRIDSKVATVEG